MSSNSSLSFVKIGFVQSAHGIRGELYIKIPSKELSWVPKVKEFQLQVRSENAPPVEMTVERVKAHKEGVILKAKEVPDRNRAEELKGYSFSIPESFLTSAPGETVFLRELLSFEVFDKGVLVGKVIGFMDNGAHDLLRVQGDLAPDKEHLIPFVEAFIEKIHFPERKIDMDLPEGLLE